MWIFETMGFKKRIKVQKSLLFTFLISLMWLQAHAQNPAHFFIGQEEFANTHVYSIEHHPNGLLYAATNYGLYVYRHGKFNTVPWNCEHKGSSLFSLRRDSKDNLYCANLSGQIFKIVGDSIELFLETPKQYIANTYFSFGFDDKDSPIVVSKGVTIYRNGNWKSLFIPKKKTLYSVNYLKRDSILIPNPDNSQMLVITNGKIDVLADEPLMQEVLNQGSFRFGFRSDNCLYSFGDEGYTYQYGASREQYLLPREKYIGPWRYIATNSQNLFALSVTRGICPIQFNDSVSTAGYQFSDFFISCIDQKEFNSPLFLGTFGNGIIVVPNTDILEYAHDANQVEKLTLIKEEYVGSLVPDIPGFERHVFTDNGEALFASKNYMEYFDGMEFGVLPDFSSIICNSHVLTNPVQRFGTIKGAVRINQKTFAFASSDGIFKLGEGLPYINWTSLEGEKNYFKLEGYDKRCHSIAYLPETQELFFSALDELVCIDGKGKRKTIEFNGKPIVCLNIEICGSKVYCATHEHGVLIIEGGKVFGQLSLEEGLQDMYVRKLYVHKDNLYISHRSGVQIFNIKTNRWKVIDELFALRSSVSDFLAWEDRLWMTSGSKIISIPLDAQSSKDYKLHLGELYLGGKLQHGLNGASVSHDSDKFRLSLDFRGIIYERVVNIEYRMNGTDWKQLPATASELIFEALSPGDYQVDIRVNHHDQFSDEHTITFTIRPPFWQTWWFYILIAIVVSMVVLSVYRRQLRKNRLEQKLVTDRLESELKALRSQMNPHFIFNSLNSIQDLVMQQDTKNTYDYIVLFSQLVRNTLNYSSLDFIPIEKEIAFLEVYLSLEKLRFKEDFDYSIHCDLPEDYEVPSLLIQPFLENALVHGLMHKHGAKRLDVEFKVKDECVECRIMDNGIGRKRAKEILDRQRGEHKSFATEAIEQRLNLINEQSDSKIASYKIKDLYKQGEPSGTLVIVTLPIRTDDDLGN